MLKITIQATGQVVLNSDSFTGQRHNETIAAPVNGMDGFELVVKNLLIEDIAVFIGTVKCPQPIAINVETGNYTWILNFTLSGGLHVQSTNTKKLTMVENSYHSLLPIMQQQATLQVSGEAKILVVCLTGNTVKKLLSTDEKSILQKQSAKEHSWHTAHFIPPAMQQLINTVMHGAETNAMHRILLAAKMLELLFMDLERIKKRKPQHIIPAARLSDLQKLEEARVLIGENLQAPCSLIELAHKVGLNDFKLKKGFKEFFGTTVFGYLADLRMDEARKMLLSAQYTVSEVAHTVGYKNAHHFTAAFKKKFGHVPSKAGQAV